jgi:hypothetical protein
LLTTSVIERAKDHRLQISRRLGISALLGHRYPGSWT